MPAKTTKKNTTEKSAAKTSATVRKPAASASAKATTGRGKTSVKVARLAPKQEPVAKLRIRVQAYEYKILDLSVKQIIDTALRYDAKVLGPIPLPTMTKKYTVGRSSFIFKNAREQFEMRVHKRLIDILNPNPKIMEALTNMSLPSGVNIDVKII